jgi:hypothetical protein
MYLFFIDLNGFFNVDFYDKIQLKLMVLKINLPKKYFRKTKSGRMFRKQKRPSMMESQIIKNNQFKCKKIILI